MSDEILKVPIPSGGDRVYALVRTILSAIPACGGPATELFNVIVTPPIEARRDEWRKQVGERLAALATNHGVDLEALQKDEAFMDVVMQTTHIAMRNRQVEKRKALCNAITNSALPNAPDESKRQMFLHFIDQFTVWHTKVLKLLSDPNGWVVRSERPRPLIQGGSALAAILWAFPDLKNDPPFCEAIWNDLRQSGLASEHPPFQFAEVPGGMIGQIPQATPGIQSTMTAPFGPKFTTSLGDEFLAFINSPDAPAGGTK
jgi:hypothetical protein